MFGNKALDIVIGLVFIYLLYSLYSTVIMEIISSFLGLRARNLSYAMSRMLMDEKVYSSWVTKWAARLLTTFSRITGKSINMENPRLFDDFFNQPSIKYLSSGGVGNTPSYLSPANFTKALIDAIRVDNPHAPLMGCIEEGLQRYPDSETRRQIESFIYDANGDQLKFKILLENWFNDTMERSTGWFKQSTQMILVIIGFFLVVSFNVDTLALFKKLSHDDVARNHLANMAVSFSEKNATLIERLEGSPADTALKKSVEAVNIRLDSLKAVRASLEQDIRNSQQIMASDWNIPDSIYYSRSSLKPGKDFVEFVINTPKKGEFHMLIHHSVDQVAFRRALKCGLSSVKAEHKTGYFTVGTKTYKFQHVFSWEHFWGYLLTVIALSLGAPFWFDVLNKLVKLRTSKAIATEHDQKPGHPGVFEDNRSILNRVG